MTKSPRPFACIALAVLMLAVTCAIYLVSPAPLLQPTPQVDTPAAPTEAIPIEATTTSTTTPHPQVEPERPAVRRLDPPKTATIPRSPLADKLHAADADGTQDIAIVFTLFSRYRERYGGFPTGEDNRAFVNALTGNNPQRLAFIDRNHPAINLDGVLVDRWGAPFFFHLESRDSLQIRSAGPDRELYTADDLVKGSPLAASL